METSKNSKPFWNKCKPYFSNKHAHGEFKIIPIEKENITFASNEVAESEKLIVKNDEIAKIFNKHFSPTVYKLSESDYTEDQLTNIINKNKSHPSIKKIKSNYTIKQKFYFKPVNIRDIENVIKNIPTNKVTGVSEKCSREKSPPEKCPRENCPQENYPPEISPPQEICPRNNAPRKNALPPGKLFH